MAKQYITYTIPEADNGKQELYIALLQDFGFDGFEQSNTQLVATGESSFLDTESIEIFLTKNKIFFFTQTIEEENWNQKWESSFEPVIIENFCAIRAAFHAPIAGVKFDLIITPKMSFGTGHHATTWMMVKTMQAIDFKNKTVIDFGTGTAVLAILADKMGAQNVVAIDNDDWCIENGNENIAANNCSKIKLLKANDLSQQTPVDIILANINKNIILASLPLLKRTLKKEGILIISGILQEDKMEVIQKARISHLKDMHIVEKNNWLCIGFQ